MLPRLKAWASLFRTQVQFRAKLGRRTPTRGGLKLFQVNAISLQLRLHSNSSEADHMTNVPGSIRQTGPDARGSTVRNWLRGRTSRAPTIRPRRVAKNAEAFA